MKEIILSEKEEGKRLDEALLPYGIAPSRSRLQSLIKEKAILVNGEAKKPSYIVCLSDVVTYQETTNKKPTLAAENIPFEIVYEDEDLLVTNKPAGLVVHPGNGHHDGTLVNALLYREKNLSSLSSNDLRPGIVHRIDKDTSGLLVVAKTDKAFLGLSNQLRDHSMHREYLALVEGIIEENRAKIDAPIGRDPKHPVRFAVNLAKGKEAITYFEVKERYSEKLTLIDCRLLTGRTHQIRVHLDYIHHPLEGDPLYGENNKRFYQNGQLLHAYRLTFEHPVTGKTMTFEAPLPKHFKEVLDRLHPYR